MKLYVNMLFIMSDITPVEGTPVSGLDSAEKPSQDTLRGVFDRFTELAKKPSALPLPFRPGVKLRVQSDSTIIPIIINQEPASLYCYGPESRDIDKDLPSFELVVNKIVKNSQRLSLMERQSYCLYDTGEETIGSERFKLISFFYIEDPNNVTQVREEPGLINRRYAHDFTRVLDKEKGLAFVSEYEAQKLLRDLMSAK